MKKVLNWMLNHMKIVLAAIVFPVTLIIGGCVILGSYQAHQKYERDFDKVDLEARSKILADPNSIEFQDNFISYKSDGSIKSCKSKYKVRSTIWASEMTVDTTQSNRLVQNDDILMEFIPCLSEGGTISAGFTLEEKSFVDIDFVIGTEYSTGNGNNKAYGVEDLLNNVTFVVNNSVMAQDELKLENAGEGIEWHHLVMKGFALPKGDVNIEIRSISGKEKMMPEVRNISLISNVGTIVK